MWNMTVFLSLIWVMSLLYGEWLSYLIPHWNCSWPHLQQSMLNGTNGTSDYVKVAIITDPQLMDRTSLHLAPNSLALEIAQFYTDLYMRRAFLSSVLPFHPDAIIFLGDYFDGGDMLSDEEWEESLGRFKHIFNLNMLQQTSTIKVHFLSGNHDIGYSASNSQKAVIVKRYEREFGARNFRVTLGKVDFIAVDAQTLDAGPAHDECVERTVPAEVDDGLPHGNLTSASWNFVKSVSNDTTDSTPRVLLTHIPLFRPDWTHCGSHRSSAIINQRIHRAGRDQQITYQNYITKASSTALLDLIKPALVLSGHDHDQCTVTHSSKDGAITEHTVGTISWQMGNLYPSFMLLSATNSSLSDGRAVTTHLCMLPMQTHIYIWYLCLFAMTLTIVLLWPGNEVAISRKLGGLLWSLQTVFQFTSSSLKEKNEDKSCEYEEIWDAEGSMHLIKKASKPVQKTNDRTSTERGSAVMRSNARKQMGEDTETLSPDVSINMGHDGMAKMQTRANKSNAKMLVWRLLRALRAVSTIAAINVPLYVLLIFKDWIDK